MPGSLLKILKLKSNFYMQAFWWNLNLRTETRNLIYLLFKSPNVTHLHKTSLKSRFLHVEFKNPFCRAQSVLQFG